MIPKFVKELDYAEYFATSKYCVVDLETTNIERGSALIPDNRIVGWVLFDNARGRVYRSYSERNADSIRELLDHLSRMELLVAHNAKFELQWLQRHGLKPGSILVWDTMLAQYVIAGNRSWDLSLEGTAKHYGLGSKESYVSKLIHGGICPSEIPPKRLMDYCEQDVALTTQVFKKQRELMYDEEYRHLLGVLFTRSLTCMCLSDIEFSGLYIDSDEVGRLYHEEAARSRAILAELDSITGGMNPKSPKQVAEFLYDKLGFNELTDASGEPLRTSAGGRKTDEATIVSLRPSNNRQRAFSKLFLSYIPVKKRFETLTKLHECANNERIVKANFNQCVSRTHRLTSSGRNYKIQFQNIDRDFKRLFVPRKAGYLMCEADAPQLEFRVAAFLGQDHVAFRDIDNHADVHRYTASVLLKKPEAEISKAERTGAKSYTFKPLYGGNSGTEDQKRYFRAFKEKYSGINKTQVGWTHKVLKEKKLQIPSGLTFYWPDCKIDPRTGYITHTTEIFNYPVQSLATADIIPISLVYLWYRLMGHDATIVNTVHDSIVCEVREDLRDFWEEQVKLAFTSDTYNYLKQVYGIKFNVTLGVGYNIGNYWGDGKEELYEQRPGEE